MKIIKDYSSIRKIKWDSVQPDKNNDWINQRDENYQKYFSINSKESINKSVFKISAIGSGTYRDVWVSGFSQKKVNKNTHSMINFYNELVNKNVDETSLPRIDKKIKWTRALENDFSKGKQLSLNKNAIVLELYRPFTKKWLYYDRSVVEMPGLYLKKWGSKNMAIVTTGRSTSKGFSTLITQNIPDRNLMSGGAQGFMRYDNEKRQESLLINDNSNITKAFANKLGLSEDDTFSYVYGLLNSKEYQAKYQNDLTKDLARIPLVQDKKRYVEIGKKLMALHLNYEQVPVYNDVEIKYSGIPNYKVNKMKFAKHWNTEGKLEKDRSKIIFNDSITVSGIPDKAYQYIVNGKSAIEWIMDQYQIKYDKKSDITDDPNDYSNDPKYIFNLLLRIINVSVQTVDLINQLPPLKIDENKN